MSNWHSSEKIEEAVKLHKKGLSATEISRKMGIPSKTVSNWVSGRLSRKAAKKRAERDRLREEARKMYAETLNRSETARRLGLPRATVADWIRDLSDGVSEEEKKKRKKEKREARERAAAKRAEERRTEQRRKGARSKKSVYPPGAEAYHDGLFYKRGIHGKIFYWNGEEWRKSSLGPDCIHWSLRGAR